MPNKKIPDEFLLAFKQALNHFSKLSDKNIFIYETPFVGVQHASRAYPPVISLGFRKSKWVYPIVVNQRRDIKIFFQSLSLEQKIGLLAHELSHVFVYSNFSRLGMIIFCIRYAFNKNFVRKIEKETDLRVVANGAGKCLFMERIAVFKFRRNKPYPETEDTYISPAELLDNLKKYPELYSEADLAECLDEFKLIEEELKYLKLPMRISASRKMKHSLKTLIAFLPEFCKIFYIVLIEKIYKD